jgi:hypothetical protein
MSSIVRKKKMRNERIYLLKLAAFHDFFFDSCFQFLAVFIRRRELFRFFFEIDFERLIFAADALELLFQFRKFRFRRIQRRIVDDHFWRFVFLQFFAQIVVFGGDLLNLNQELAAVVARIDWRQRVEIRKRAVLIRLVEDFLQLRVVIFCENNELL